VKFRHLQFTWNLPRVPTYLFGDDTFEDSSEQWQVRLIPHQRIDLIAASEASVAICYSNSVRGRVRRERETEWRSMRVTVSHNQRKEEIVRAVDRSFNDLFKGLGTVPIQIVNESRKWTGSRMDFSFDAKMGIVSTPIKGFIDVTDKDVTVDADLGWLERLFPAKQTQAALEGRVKGLLT
jgi:hypothetical protein